MDFLLANVAEKLIWDHHVLPSYGFVEFELDFIDFVSRLHVDEEIGVVEDGIDQKIRTVFDIINFASGGFNEDILRYPSFAFLQQNPAMYSLSEVEIGSKLIRFIVINSKCLSCQLFLSSLLIFNHGLVEGGVCNSFGEDCLVKIEFLLDVLVFVGLPDSGQEVTLHQGLVFACDFFGSDTVNTIGIVANSDEK